MIFGIIYTRKIFWRCKKMINSDGSGFFAIGILMMFVTYQFCKFFLDNILWFFLGLIVYIILSILWTTYGYMIVTKISRWWQGIVRRFLLKFFNQDLYSNNFCWYGYCAITYCIEMVGSLFLLLLCIRLFAYIL